MLSRGSKWVPWLLGLLMLLAPLFRSGKIPLALLLLELLSVVILLLLWWRPARRMNLSTAQVVALVSLMLIPLVYLIPVPASFGELFPGRADYVNARIYAGGVEALEWQTLSLYSRETLAGWLVLLLPLATFVAARSLDTRQLRGLLSLLFVIAAFEAVLGLVQFGSGAGSPFYLGMVKAYGSAVGTYTSRNNYVGLMYMVLMMTLALFMATLGRHRARVGNQTFRQRMVYLSTMKGHQAFLYATFSLLLLLAIVFSRSRTGIGLTMVGVVLASLLFARRIGGKNVFGMTGTVVAIVLGFGISIGLAPVLDRFAAGDAVSNARWTIFEGTIQGISQFFPVGSGSATFRETFPAFQNVDQGSYIINNAHNDYLEWVYDGGLLAGLLILGLLLLYGYRWTSVWKTEKWGEFRFIQVGAGLGMLLILLHELVDYNLYVPANMVFFAFLAAVYFHEYDESEVLEKGVKSPKQHESVAQVDVPAEGVPTERMRTGAAVGIDEGARNPFMD